MNLTHANVLSLYNKVALNMDPINEVLLASVQTDRFGLPIGIDSARRACEVVDHLIKIADEYDLGSLVLHFDKAYNLLDGSIRTIPGGYKLDITSRDDVVGFAVSGGVDNDVSDSV